MTDNHTSSGYSFSGSCQWCSSDYQKVYHSGKCPFVKSIEFYENGALKKVEFVKERMEDQEFYRLELPLSDEARNPGSSSAPTHTHWEGLCP